MHNAWNQPPAELVGCIELFEAAMAIDGHRRVIEAYARQLRTR